MTVTLGLDIGSNSVGSAWVDTEKKEIVLGVSVFPAGVDESETKRGSPKNQHRRAKRSQRKNLARRAARRRRLRELLTSAGLLPADPIRRKMLMEMDPWQLRRKGLTQPLGPHEFGRVLVHLNQRRGAWGVQTDPEDTEEGAVKEAIDHLAAAMRESGAKTFGEFAANFMDTRRHPIPGKCNLKESPPSCPPNCASQDAKCRFYRDPVRNRRDTFEFHAPRELIHAEFVHLWSKQKELGGPLARLLTDELRTQIHDPSGDKTWRQRGVVFGQRKTYWNLGTLGRCDLEPSDRCCPLADMHAQEFRVLETVNNIRVEKRGQAPRVLTPQERANLISVLRAQKTASVSTVRKALDLHRKGVKDFFSLNIERDKDREINTDWFYRQIVHGVFGEPAWLKLSEAQRESVNRAILKFDPESPADANRLRNGAAQWWALPPEAADGFIEAWKARPRLEKRLNLSRRAVLNLLPYMRQWGCSVTEARQLFAEDANNGATPQQRERYALGGSVLSKADRRFLRKHPDLLPPAPMLPNPVVRKAIHEVRRHVMAYTRKFGRKPDRIIIELAKQARQTEKVRNKLLAANRQREKERKAIMEQFNLAKLPLNQQRTAVERVSLCRQQNGICPYSNLTAGAPGTPISEKQAAEGKDVETDHIVPLSRSQDNFLSNKVLCYRNANRGKGKRTPKEWLAPEQFALLEQRMAHWETEFPRKWENLHHDPLPEQDFLDSQLKATAYAANQVGAYLQDRLYGGQRDGRRRVFFSKGPYTAMLRKDWQLFQTLKDPHDLPLAETPSGPLQDADPGKKNREDHRHHAIDALILALTGPEIIQDVARLAAEREEYHERTGYWPKRTPLPPPWADVREFRRQALSQVFDVFDKANLDGIKADGAEFGAPLIVSHRPVKRKAKGYLHKDDLWGAVDEEQGVYRISCPVADLNPNMLRMPVEEDDNQARQRLMRQCMATGMTRSQARRAANERIRRPDFKRIKVDPPLGKGGLVRDWSLRQTIRDCLKQNRIDPDNFTPKQIQDFAKTQKLRMPSGVPIRTVVTIGPISDPIKVPVRDPNTGRQALNPRTGTPLFRYHISRNNHHVEIMADVNTGDWSPRNGKCVSMFEAAARVRPPKKSGLARPPSPDPVNRQDEPGHKFVMSLSEGEMVHATRPDRPARPDYFVVVKLDSTRIFFAPHWDARTEKAQDRWSATYAGLKHCGPANDRPPFKVRVSPLGQAVPVHHD